MDFVGIRCPGDKPPCELAGLVALTATLIEAVPLTSATLDGFTDCRDLPDEAAQGLAQLEQVAAKKHELYAHAPRWHRWLRRTGPTNMAMTFDLTERSRSLVTAFAPYSIHAELRNHQGTVELVLHDSGGGVSLSADQDVDVSQVAKILDEVRAEYRRSS